MDPEAFDSLVQCVTEGSFDTCEAVPQGDSNGFLANPLGGVSVEMAGPAGYARVRREADSMSPYEASCTGQALLDDDLPLLTLALFQCCHPTNNCRSCLEHKIASESSVLYKLWTAIRLFHRVLKSG